MVCVVDEVGSSSRANSYCLAARPVSLALDRTRAYARWYPGKLMAPVLARAHCVGVPFGIPVYGSRCCMIHASLVGVPGRDVKAERHDVARRS